MGATFCTIDGSSATILQGAWTDPHGASSRSIRAVWTSSPIPNDALAVAADLPTETRAALMRALASPTPLARQAMKLVLRADDFRAATGFHYAPLRALLGGRAPSSGKIRT